MGVTVSAGHSTFSGSEPDDGPEAHLEECVFGPNAGVDLSWLREVPGLSRVTFYRVRFHDVKYGREELMPMLEGREEPVLKGCRLCDHLIPGDEGSSDVCPDELSNRCVMSA